MTQIKTYRPGVSKVTAAATLSNNGQSLNLASNTLSNWNRLIVFGTVKGSGATALSNAGVRVYQLAASGDPLSNGVLIATVFTDAQGEYGVSLQTLTAPAVYKFEAFAAGN